MQSKKGVLALIAILVAVIVIAALAYNTLAAHNAERDFGLPSEASTSAESSDKSSDESSAEASSSSETDDASNAGPIKLADFKVLNREGKEVALSSMYGKPTLVGFWATWCPPCNQEAPEIQKLYDAYGDQVNFMMIDSASDGRDTPQSVEEWLASNNYTYPVYIDTTGEAAAAAELYYLPTMFVLDKEGTVLTAFSGALDEENGAQLIEQLLAQE